MKNHALREDPAFPVLTIDLLGSLLSRADNPGGVGTYLTDEIRELTGARCVLLIQSPDTPLKLAPRVLNVNPERRRGWAESCAANRLYEIIHASPDARIWRADESSEAAGLLRQEGFALSLSAPLNVGAARVGLLLALGLPEETHVASELRLLSLLSGVVALVLRNAFLYESQEQAIQERTRELQAANQSLRDSEEKYRHLAELSPEPIFIGCDGRFVFVNPALMRLLGAERPEQLLGKTVMDFIHPDFREVVAQRIRSGAPAPLLEEKYLRLDGTVVDVEVAAAPMQWAGRPAGQVVVRNISERKQAVADLLRSEERYRLIFTRNPLPMWVYERNTLRFLEVNEAAVKHYGYTEAEFRAMTLRDIRPPEDVPALEALVPRIPHGLVNTGEWRHCRKDGTVMRVSIHSHDIDLQGRSARLVLAEDITARKRAEETLRLSEARLNRAEAIAGLGSWEFDFDKVQPAWSDEAYRIFGLPPQSFPASYQAYLDAVHPEDRAAADAAYSGSLREGKDAYEIEHRIVRKLTGEIRVVHVKCEHVQDDAGRIIRSTGMVHDITERKQTEEALQQLSRKNEEALRVAHMGHWEFDVTTGLFTFNDLYYALHGATAQEVGGYQMTAEDFAQKFVHPGDAHRVEEVIQMAITADDPNFQLQTEARIFRAGGEVRLVTVWFRVEKDAKGRTIKLYGVNQDITERRRAEEALARSESTLRGFYESAPMLMGIVELIEAEDILHLYDNPAAARFLGIDYKSTEGKRASQLGIPSAVLRQWVAHYLQSRDLGRPVHFEYAHAVPGGARWLSATVSTIGPGDSGRLRFCYVAEDITARKQAEEARLESEQRFRTLAEATLEGIALAENGVLVDLNDQLAAMMGYPREELIGQPVLKVVAPASRAMVEESMRAGRPDQVEHLALRRDGSQFPIEVRARSARIGDRVLRIASILDITEHKKMEADLRGMLDEKTTLLKEVHHRVKNNLQIITSLLNLQAGRVQDPLVLDLLQDTRQRVRSMALLHETLYRSENVARINFAVYVENLCAHIFRSFGGASGRVRFRCRIGRVELGLDQAIPCGLIINELVSNALKHAFPGNRDGEIAVAMDLAGNQDITLSVADDGVGLPPGYESRQGQTLGLQLVTILAAQLKGEVQVQRDGGTIFRVTFRAKLHGPPSNPL